MLKQLDQWTTKGTWIRFQFWKTSDSGKTKAWKVTTDAADEPGRAYLGSIEWFGRWRCYGFFPLSATIYEPTCLREIAEFCEERTKEHRKGALDKRRAAKAS